MKYRSWLSTCSTASNTATAATPPTSSSKIPLFDTASSGSNSCSDIQTPSSLSSATSNSSLHSNLSLLTLPSVPSLQKLYLSPGNSNPSATALLISSFKPRSAHINFLTLHNNLLYAASGYEINVFEIISNTIFDTFNSENISFGSVKSITFSDGKVFTVHQDCKIRIWKLNLQKQHKLIATLPTLIILKFDVTRKFLWIEHNNAVE